ncbi:MAG: hypothetical protein IT405_02430 [Candidatus Yanofskybacteria bacterium]|nr:hypothetical protein [Candidatus Yanofskybacteria bacterium]
MRRRLRELSPEELKQNEEGARKRKAEQERAQAEYNAETERILSALENSATIREIKAYLEANPLPEWRAPDEREKLQFPSFPAVPEYKQEQGEAPTEEWKEGAVHKWWVCQSCGAKTIANESKTVRDEDGEDSGYIHASVEHPAPVGWDTPLPGENPTRARGVTPPPECCYSQAVEKYKADCREVRKKNELAQKEWNERLDRAQQEYREAIEKWVGNAPEKVRSVFPDGRPGDHNGTRLGKWIMSTPYGIERDSIFRAYVLKDLEELEKAQ